MKKIMPAALVLVMAASLRAGLYDRDAQGWTVLTPSPDSRIIYVSSSEGNDANNGLSAAAPKRTIAAGVALLRSDPVRVGGEVVGVTGYPDHLLLKRGDTWDETLGGWWKSGRSSAEPMVVGTYGTGDRPRIRGRGVFSGGGGPGVPTFGDLALVGLHFVGTSPTGKAGGDAFNVKVSAHDLLLEDVRSERIELVFEEWKDEIVIVRIQVRRSMVHDTFSTDSHSQCVYLAGVGEALLEENVFDRCGWNPDVAGAEPTIFNHCVYWQYDGPADGIVRNNIISRCSSHGVQMRSSGRVEGNLIIRTAIAGFLAGNFETPPAGIQGTAIGNVILEGSDILPRDGHSGNVPRGWGWGLTDGVNGTTGGDLKRVVVRDNIIAHCQGNQCETGQASWEDSEFDNNIVWDWPQGNRNFMPPTPGPFVDPDRTVASYNDSLGRTATFEAFMDEVFRQSKDNWRTEYTAAPVAAYIRAGFARPGGDAVPPARPRGLRFR